MAAQEAYEFYPCKIDIIASEDWQPNSAFEVRVRITLTPQYSYKLRIHSVGVIVSSEGFSYDDTKQDDTILGALSEYWEKAFSFNFSTDELGRGENFNVSIVAIVDMYKLINMWEYEELWYNSDDPMIVTLYMPSAPAPTPTLTTAPEPTPKPEPFPTTLVIATSVIIGVIFIGLFVYFRIHKPLSKQKTQKTT